MNGAEFTFPRTQSEERIMAKKAKKKAKKKGKKK